MSQLKTPAAMPIASATDSRLDGDGESEATLGSSAKTAAIFADLDHAKSVIEERAKLGRPKLPLGKPVDERSETGVTVIRLTGGARRVEIVIVH